MQKEILNNLPACVQSLYSNGNLYWSGNKDMQSIERKGILLADIKTIIRYIDILKKDLEK